MLAHKDSSLDVDAGRMMKKAIVMDERDNVATALHAIEAGDEIEILSAKQEVVQRIKARDSLPLRHKIAHYLRWQPNTSSDCDSEGKYHAVKSDLAYPGYQQRFYKESLLMYNLWLVVV